jgi:hypothetical protein
MEVSENLDRHFNVFSAAPDSCRLTPEEDSKEIEYSYFL